MEPTSGTFLVDGRLVEDRRPAVAAPDRWVPQDPTLLAGTVADNIRLGTGGLRRGGACSGGRRATDFIGDLPHGVDTVLGEQGCG